jgi:hypothetical protein
MLPILARRTNPMLLTTPSIVCPRHRSSWNSTCFHRRSHLHVQQLVLDECRDAGYLRTCGEEAFHLD